MAIDVEIDERIIRYAAELLVQAQQVVAFTGPGISPDHDPALDWITLEHFLADPPQFWQEYDRQRKILKTARPTAAHDALAEMEFILDKFFLITQTTDGLHQAACSTRLVEIHGNLRQARCIQCDYETDEFDLGDQPRCPVCQNWLRPAVIWPDESLPAEDFSAACEACELADIVISIGNPAESQPAASMIWQAKATGSCLIEINPTLTSASHLADLRLTADPEKILPALVGTVKEFLPHSQPITL